MSSQCRVSFQAFVVAPTMKCFCPKKPYTHSGGFPDLRETEKRRRSRRKSAVGTAHSHSGQPEKRESQRRRLIHRAALTARLWQRLWSLANGTIQSLVAVCSHAIIHVTVLRLSPKHYYFCFCCLYLVSHTIFYFFNRTSSFMAFVLLNKKLDQHREKNNYFFAHWVKE